MPDQIKETQESWQLNIGYDLWLDPGFKKKKI